MTFNRANPWQSYRQVVTQTASPGQLVLMLYDGALRFLGQALVGFTKDDPLEFNLTINENVQRAQAILQELNRTLNMEEGGQFSATLRLLYDYLDRRLQESNVHKTEEGIHEVLRRVTILRDAWAEMLAKSAGAPAPSSVENAVA